MHGYSTDSDERRVVPLLLAILGIALGWTSSGLLARAHLSVPWWMEGPSSLAFYGALYAFFDKHLWKYRVMRWLGLVKTPNLNGRWRGYLTSSFDHHAKRHDVIVSIFQTWTQISVFLMTRTSLSRSCVAVVQVSDPEGVALVYQYQNEPLANAASTMHMHYGTAMLRMPNRTGLIGAYYAGRDRGTFGQISCCKTMQGNGETGLTPRRREEQAWINQGGGRMAEPKVIVPKRGDRVGSSQDAGIFEVVGVNSLMQTANLRAVDGRAPVVPNVPWTALKALDKK